MDSTTTQTALLATVILWAQNWRFATRPKLSSGMLEIVFASLDSPEIDATNARMATTDIQTVSPADAKTGVPKDQSATSSLVSVNAFPSSEEEHVTSAVQDFMDILFVMLATARITDPLEIPVMMMECALVSQTSWMTNVPNVFQRGSTSQSAKNATAILVGWLKISLLRVDARM